MSYPTVPPAGSALPSTDLADLAFNPAYTYGETLAVGDAVYLKAADSKIYKADADVKAQVDAFVGIVATAGVLNDTNRIFAPGKVATGLSGLTAGTLYYLSNTPGALSATSGTYNLIIAIAISTTSVLVLRTSEDKRIGDSSDGAFAQSSGTTTLNTAGKEVYQYSSFALTGTAVLTVGSNLQNTRVFILVDGDLTITSSATPAVQMSGFGALGGPAGSAGSNGLGIASNSASGGLKGNSDVGPPHNSAKGGGGGAGVGAAGTNGGTGGTGGATGIFTLGITAVSSLLLDFLGCGAGGGAGGATPSFVGGAGGNGGGCIIFIVKGNINLTGAMSATGLAGTNGQSNANEDSGGGGGGGGGVIAVFYGGSVTANTSVITVTAGAGGTSGSSAGGIGGVGFSVVRKMQLAYSAVPFIL